MGLVPLQDAGPSNVGSCSSEVRAVCLLPGLTDIVSELGQSTKIVANSHECCAQGTKITAPKLPLGDIRDTSLSSAELSAGWSSAKAGQSPVSCDLRTRLSQLVCSFYYVDVMKLAVSRPTIVITILPQPKSFLDPSIEEIVEALKLEVPSVQEVLSIDPTTLSEVFASIHKIAIALKCRDAANRAVVDAKSRLEQVSQSMERFHGTLTHKNRQRKLPRVAIVQWADPIYVAGHWIPEVVGIGGGRADMFVRPGGPSITIATKQLLEHDIVVFAICAVKLTECRNVCKKFIGKHSALLQNRNPRFIATDATILFSRPSLSAVILSAEVISEIVSGSGAHGHRGVVWSDVEADPDCG